MAKNGWKLSKVAYYREYPVAFGQKREIVGVGQSDTANNTLCRYCFHGTSVFGQKAPGATVFGHCPKIKARTAEERWMKNPVWPSSCCCLLHINQSGLNHTQYYTWCQSGTWSAGQKEIRGTSTKKNTKEEKKRLRERNKKSKIHKPEKDRRRAFDRESLA